MNLFTFQKVIVSPLISFKSLSFLLNGDNLNLRFKNILTNYYVFPFHGSGSSGDDGQHKSSEVNSNGSVSHMMSPLVD